MIHKPKYNIKFIDYKIKYLQKNQIPRFKRGSKSSVIVIKIRAIFLNSHFKFLSPK